jgi:hypothetical protein
MTYSTSYHCHYKLKDPWNVCMPHPSHLFHFTSLTTLIFKLYYIKKKLTLRHASHVTYRYCTSQLEMLTLFHLVKSCVSHTTLTILKHGV